MSDSAVIRLWQDQQDEHPLGIYLHWGGSSYAEELATGIALAKNRWDDPDYANRIVVSHLAYCFASDETGMGLFTGTDSRGEDHPALNVNWGSKVVWNHDQRIPFEQYIKGEWKVMQ